MAYWMLSDEDLVEYLYNKLESEKYWILVGLPDDGNVVSMFCKIEDGFFPAQTSLNKEFELITGPRCNIAIFTKKRISVEELTFITGYAMTEKDPMLLPSTVENSSKVQELGKWVMEQFTEISQKRNSSK